MPLSCYRVWRSSLRACLAVCDTDPPSPLRVETAEYKILVREDVVQTAVAAQQKRPRLEIHLFFVSRDRPKLHDAIFASRARLVGSSSKTLLVCLDLNPSTVFTTCFALIVAERHLVQKQGVSRENSKAS